MASTRAKAMLFGFLIFSANGCLAMNRNQSATEVDKALAELIRRQGTAPASAAQCVGIHMLRSAQRQRGNTGRYRRKSALFGGLATGVGAVTTTLVAALRPTDTKTGVGIGGGLLTAVVGVLQTIHAAGSDPGAYVSSTDQAVAQYMASQFSTSKDVQARADSVLFAQAADIKSKFPEFANFTVIQLPGDTSCVPTVPTVRTKTPEQHLQELQQPSGQAPPPPSPRYLLAASDSKR